MGRLAVIVVGVGTIAVSGCDGADRPEVPVAGAPSITASVPQVSADCGAVPLDPANAGSFEAMAGKPVAAAIGGHAGLTVLAGVVRRAGLMQAWDAATAVTVFAPTNRAFEKLSELDRKRLLGDKKALSKVLSYHVLPQRLSPADLAGSHRSLQGGDVVVEVEGRSTKVNGSATVLCGNVQTRNATIYIIDSVLMPGT